MKKTLIGFISILLVLSFLSAVDLKAQGAGKGKQQDNSPFLLTGKMPHLTRLLMQQWDNAKLHLSDQQKSKLLLVRKKTIGDVQKLGQQITPLEKQVALGSLSGKKPEELQALVNTIAGLRAEATMVHLRCIFDTRNILDKQQVDFLNNLQVGLKSRLNTPL